MSSPSPYNSAPADLISLAIEPQAIILSTLAAISLLTSLPPLIVHFQKHNIPTTTLILSIALLNLQNTINPPIWPNDDKENWFSGHILCDIEAKLQVGLVVAIPGAATCICKNLAGILSSTSPTQTTTTTLPGGSGSGTNRQQLLFETTLCLILPTVIMSLHILVQPYRYFIHGITGCLYSTSQTYLTFPVLFFWPITVTVIGAVYAALIIHRLIRHGRQVSSLLAPAHISTARFARVFALAGLVIAVYLPLSLYSWIQLFRHTSAPWTWETVHPAKWDRIVIKVMSHGSVGYEHWIHVALGFVVFVVFGTGEDAVGVYRRWACALKVDRVWKWLQKRLVVRKDKDRSDRVVRVPQRQMRGIEFVNNSRDSFAVMDSGVVSDEIELATAGESVSGRPRGS